MAFNTFTPTVAPEISSPGDAQVRELSATFGDGYSQVAPDGLNALRRSFEPSWPALSVDDFEDIVEFFEANKGVPFKYTPPLESVEIVWRCSSWKPGYAGGDKRSLQAQFVQDFSIEV